MVKGQLADWQLFNPQNPHVIYSESKNKWKCKTCGDVLQDKQSIAKHSIRNHNMNLLGVQVPPKDEIRVSKTVTPPKGEETGDELDLTIEDTDSEDTRIMKKHLLSILTEKEEKMKASSRSLADQIQLESSRDIVNSASQLVQDVDIMWLYFKTKRLFPKTYQFADFIRACVYYTLRKAFNVQVSIGYGVEGIEPEMVAYLVKNLQEWDELFKVKESN